METSNDTNKSFKNLRWRCLPTVFWRWLIEPAASIIDVERRHQARLLTTILLLLIILTLFSLILSLFRFYASPEIPKSVDILLNKITLVTILLLSVAFGFSRSKLYPVAAGLFVIIILSATFVVVIANPGNPQFQYFLILGGLLTSLFLSPRMATIIFAVTLLGLISLHLFVASFSDTNLPALFFILMVGGVTIIASNIRHDYLKQIHRQTQRLAESEEALRELSIRDSLTGLFNRRYLTETLAIEMLRTERNKYPIGIIMVDIDNFKHINDTHGHAAGDAVLVQIGAYLRSHVRPSDLTCRVGGEEFILVLPEATLMITKLRADHVRENAGHMNMQYKEQTLEEVTLSIGVAVFPQHGASVDTILEAVDVAMYRAKHEGRDRVVVAA